MLPWLEALEDDGTAVIGICKAKSGGIGGMLASAVPPLDGKECSRSIEEGAAGRCATLVSAKANANRGQMQGGTKKEEKRCEFELRACAGEVHQRFSMPRLI
jgi:hypothetical protein